LEKDINIDKDELVIIGFPVYAGRVPKPATETLKKIKGHGNSVVTIVVYGNRDYDDALLELNDIAKKQGLKIIASAAFIAEHSFDNTIATGRPDKNDLVIAENFADKIKDRFVKHIDSKIKIKGNHPYKKRGKLPMYPVADDNCNNCGICSKLCPVQAIDLKDASIVNEELCITCVRCVRVCPQNARKIDMAPDKLKILLDGLKVKCEGIKNPEIFI